MRNPRILLPLFLLAVIVVSAFLVLRARGDQETGPAFALCPGPDQYGYRCDQEAVFPYIDATNDTFLYSDDGVIVVDLPFPFTFYGNSYQQVVLSSNGNLQFTTENSAYNNECLSQGPVSGMGELIAPYWDDLDLTLFGFLETAVSGEAGSRIFVIEWDDVPVFDIPEDRVTFEVQLFEENNDIVFLYQDVTRSQGNNGRTATIGLQSETRNNTLQYGCDQLSLINGLTIHFSHPAGAVQEGTQPAQPLSIPETFLPPTPKGDLELLIQRLNREGINALQSMHAYWLSQQPQMESQSFQADINGDGQEELILLLRPPAAYARYTQLAVLGRAGEDEQDWQLLYHNYPLARQQGSGFPESDSQERGRRLSLESVADKTADGILDVFIQDLDSGETFIFTASGHSFELKPPIAP